ncbi:RNA polymerase sigma factor [Bacillus sp. T33-2]|nr:RNA polymerase sigma factor [Bacillus sp. T33-2]
MDFSELYSLYYKRLFCIGYSITRDKHQAEDVVHETFIKAFKKADTIEDESKVGAWLSSIAARTAIDFIRREKKKKGIPMEAAMIECLGIQMTQDVEEEVETGYLMGQINTVIKRLTLEQQDVLMLKIRHGLTEAEIARHLNVKPCTVKTRFYRARKKLKHLFFLEQNTA